MYPSTYENLLIFLSHISPIQVKIIKDEFGVTEVKEAFVKEQKHTTNLSGFAKKIAAVLGEQYCT